MRLPSAVAISRIVLAAVFVLAGANHFVNPEFYVGIVPPYLHAPLMLVYLSGVFEMAGGLALLIPTLRTIAVWGLIVLLIAVFPANIHMFLSDEQFDSIPYWIIVARLPLQFLVIAWVYSCKSPSAGRG